jgi:hypothetical protein
MSGVGILAYGSLIRDPGWEIRPLIARAIETTTPFPVEYARLSRKRGGAPTVVPHELGGPVEAQVLVLLDTVSLAQAKDLLWRRETRNEGSNLRYRENPSPKAVLVRDWPGWGLDHVVYTDFHPTGKLSMPDPGKLADAAVNSVAKAPDGRDGISYLMDLIGDCVKTPLTDQYQAAILAQTGTSSLSEALESEKAKKRPLLTRFHQKVWKCIRRRPPR